MIELLNNDQCWNEKKDFIHYYSEKKLSCTIASSMQNRLEAVHGKDGSRYSRMDQVKFVEESL